MTQADALSILQTGANVFLTGEPGSGKTHTINAHVAWLRSCGIEPSVTAATGIAATHVAGVTLHSWSGIGVKEYLSPADVDAIAGKEHVSRRIRKAKTLIIEEVSMLSAATLGMADAVCREVRRNDAPFGGLQVIFVGDFFQLPPVSRGNAEAAFCYASPVWRELNPLVCYLEEQHRQEDEPFLSVLSAIRAGAVERVHYELLAKRRIAENAAPAGVPKLFSHNADVDRMNAAELAQLPGHSKKFFMKSAGNAALVEGLVRGCLSPETLELKAGATVMFTKNDPSGRFVNGTLGVVEEFAKDGAPVVRTREGKRVSVEPHDWKLETDGKIRASITQYPLRLSWAMTVHKSQGQSLDAAVMDLSRAFEYGQGYVALSRVRALGGLYLLGLNDRALMVHPEIAQKDREFRAASRAAAATFTDMPRNELEDMQKRFVKALGGAWVNEEQGAGAGSRHEARGGSAAAGFMPSRLAETLSAVRDARTLASAAHARGLAVSTVVHHLEELSALGALATEDFAHLLPDASAFAEIRAALAGVKDEKLSPVFHALRGRYSFETIRLARLTVSR